MTNEEFKKLAQKYEAGTATDIEKREFERVYNILSNKYRVWVPELMNQEEEVKIDIFNTLTDRIQHHKKSKKVRHLYRYISAAAAILIAAICLTLQNNSPTAQLSTLPQHAVAKKEDKGAVLTLENGQQIFLSTIAIGHKINQEGVQIIKTDKDKLVYQFTNHSSLGGSNSLTLPKGTQYQMTLTDGTSIWLNAASTLKYSINFQEGHERKVQLDGEAYFEVAKDKKRPFLVTTNTQEVTVLGTHFNINAYSDEPVVKTTLIEGSVQVKGMNSLKILIPDEQSTLYKSGKLEVTAVDTESAVAWKNKEFIFESEKLETIMRMIERRYNVQVIYNGEKTEETFGGGFSKFDHVSKVLKSLESTGKVHFEIEGQKIYVSKPR